MAWVGLLIVVLIIALWKVILAGLVLWGIARVAVWWWRGSELRRERVQRRRLAAIAQIRKSTVAAMVKEAQRRGRKVDEHALHRGSSSSSRRL